MENEIREVVVSPTADAADRKGVYSNLLGIRTSNKEAVPDFEMTAYSGGGRAFPAPGGGCPPGPGLEGAPPGRPEPAPT